MGKERNKAGMIENALWILAAILIVGSSAWLIYDKVEINKLRKIELKLKIENLKLEIGQHE